MAVEHTALTRLAVLKAIRRHGAISRIELAAACGLSGATITQVTAGLVARGLIVEERPASVAKGRPRTLLSIDPGAGMVVGANLSWHGGLDIALVDLGGVLIRRSRCMLGQHPEVGGLAHQIAACLETFVTENGIDRHLIASVALALPATIQNPEGLVHWLPTMRAGSTPVREIVSTALGLPVTLERDVEGLARSEHWFGDRSTTGDFTILIIGLAIGAVEYVGGVPHSGANGLGTEFAHVKTAWGEGARACFCGAHGCLTAYASDAGIVRSALAAPDHLTMDPDEIQRLFRELTVAAAAGDQRATAAFALAGAHLGNALGNIINMRDPGLVLIRSTNDFITDALAASMISALEQCCLPTHRARTDIDVGVAQHDWRWKGAAALALEQTYLGTNLPRPRYGRPVAAPIFAHG